MPFEQRGVAPGQTLPTMPQLVGLVMRSTHWLPTDVSPGLHVHAPLSQYCVPKHCVLQAPQRRGSFCVSRQLLPPQFVKPPTHAQEPPLQSPNVLSQLLPQLPQLFWSVWRSAQPLKQACVPVGQMH